MRSGSLVMLRGSIVSSYGREGQMGLVLDTSMLTDRSGYPDAEFARVLWDDGQSRLYKTTHLEIINESR
jgi:hypothetical protein